MMRYNEYTALLPQILPLVQPCPKSMALEALRFVAPEFFGRTRIWRQCFANTIMSGYNELMVSEEAELVRVEYLRLGGIRLILGMDYRIAPPNGLLVRMPTAARGNDSELWVSLRPSRTASGVPDEYATAWGDALVYGALAKIKSLSGNTVGWTDAAGAELNLKLYEAEVQRARDIATRECFGWRLASISQRGNVSGGGWHPSEGHE